MQVRSAERRFVLIVESDSLVRRQLVALLGDMGYEAVLARTVDDSVAELAHSDFLFSLLDVSLDRADASEVLRRIRAQRGDPGPIILLLNGRGLHRTMEASALGVADFLTKPVTAADLENVIKSTVTRPAWIRSRLADDGDPQSRLRLALDLWRSPRMRQVRDLIAQASRLDTPVLVSGEAGTGKDLVARAIHELSARQAAPFIKVNCAALPPESLESELFGHEPGALASAHGLKIGKFESAHRGTMLLDEIVHLHPALQEKLLRVLEDGEFSRIGASSRIKADVRVLVATNQSLEQAVSGGRFRADLFHHLSVTHIVVPPLRERQQDIPVLAEHFARRYSALFQRDGFTLPTEMMQELMRHSYPGNVRELETMIKRLIALSEPRLTPAGMPSFARVEDTSAGRAGNTTLLPLKQIGRRAAQAAEREAILQALEQTRWNRVRAAKLLRISYRALLYKIKDAGLDRDRVPAEHP